MSKESTPKPNGPKSKSIDLSMDKVLGKKFQQEKWDVDSFDLAVMDSSIKAGTILKNQVVSEDAEANYAYLVLLHGNIEVRIPFLEHTNEFDGITAETLSGTSPQSIRNQRQMLRKLINCNLEYVPIKRVTDTNGRTYILASRKLAIQRQYNKNFVYSKRIKPGEYITADVISVASGKMMVYYAGVEERIARNFVTLRHMPDLRDAYKPGDTIRLLIRDVSYDDDGKAHLQLSGVHAEHAECMSRKHLVVPGRTYAAQVVRVAKSTMPDGSPGLKYILYLTGIRYPAVAYGVAFRNPNSVYESAFSEEDALHRGQFVQFRATGFTKLGEATGFLTDVYGHR